MWSSLGARLGRRRKPGNESINSTAASHKTSQPRWNNNTIAILAVSRAVRQRKIQGRIRNKIAPSLSTALPILGFLWLLALPLDRWGRNTYFDENAIQPGQVKTFWDWGDVHLADQWLEGIESIWNNGWNSSRTQVAIPLNDRRLN